MAVFTEVSFESARALFERLQLGTLVSLRGIEGGIENTNYFADVQNDSHLHHFVLTLFERLTAEQLPFYLGLMKHLAQAGIPVPEPQANARGELLHTVCQKPAAVVNKLEGKNQLQPEPLHCAAVGDMLARMHLAGRDFAMEQPNLRSLPWWNETAPVIEPFLSQEQLGLLRAELALQNHTASTAQYAALPRGPVHADLFRDNVMFNGQQLGGFFDFYFAGVDTWLFDVAVCLNDWCIDHATGILRPVHANAFVQAYHAIRPFTAQERSLFATLLRAAALRFWISRLWDFYLPRQASMLKPHDPTHFERVLRERAQHPWKPE